MQVSLHCMCVFMYVGMQASTNARAFIPAYVGIYVCLHVRMYIGNYVSTILGVKLLLWDPLAATQKSSIL